MNYFNLHIPADNAGFGMFSAGHITWLVIGAAFCVAMCRIYRKAGNKKLIRYIVAGAALFLEIFRAVLMLCAGEYNIYTLPLHLCGIAVYLNALHAVKGGGKLGQFLYAFCFPGAVFALVFPDWEYFPLFNILTTMAFELHILIVCYIVMQHDEIQPDIRHAPGNLAIMLCLAVPVFFFNKVFSTNYMFLNWPVVPLTLFSWLGRPGYLLGYIPITALTWCVIYLPVSLRSTRYLRRR